MLLTIFLSLVFCAAVTLLLLAAVAFVQKEAFFSSAPQAAQAAIRPREKELFLGARAMGWALMGISVAVILGVGVVAIWDGLRSGFTFGQFFLRFLLIFTIYKVYDMVCFDYLLLIRSHFFQHYYPEVEPVFRNLKYGFNLKSQLLKLLVLFPAACALAAWICSRL